MYSEYSFYMHIASIDLYFYTAVHVYACIVQYYMYRLSGYFCCNFNFKNEKLKTREQSVLQN